MNLPTTIRLASALPASHGLADYEPFQPLGSGAYGVVKIADVTTQALSDVRRVFTKAFAAGTTCGYCAVPRVRAVFLDMD